MVFSSLTFLIFFLPTLLLCYFLIPKSQRGLRNFVLLIFSLFFYGWGGPKFLLLLLISIVINYLCGLYAELGKTLSARKSAVIVAVILNLGLLGWFKYAGFFAEMICSLGVIIPVPEIVLPVGISFFTFQGLSYVIDVYRKDAPAQKNPLNVALYIALFPQLVAGPIVRYTTIAEMIMNRKENLDDFSAGVVRFMLGLGKKMILANAMGEIADSIFALDTGGMAVSLAWIGIFAYTLQIYFDFSAYSDMAIGLGRMFGFHFLENFNYPYISRSITEFWRRWHISLSSWFRDYLYIPLGGSRCGLAKQIRNIAIVWLLTGLWHGAAWTFVFWGAWFCLLLIGERYLWGGLLKRSPGMLKYLYTMIAVMISWVFFRSGSISYAFSYLGAMFGSSGTLLDGHTVFLLRQYWPELILGVIGIFPLKVVLQHYLESRQNHFLSRMALAWGPKLLALFVFACSYMLLVTGSFNPFIYFQF